MYKYFLSFSGAGEVLDKYAPENFWDTLLRCVGSYINFVDAYRAMHAFLHWCTYGNVQGKSLHYVTQNAFQIDMCKILFLTIFVGAKITVLQSSMNCNNSAKDLVVDWNGLIMKRFQTLYTSTLF